ncbi:hypothetical protein EJ02DRAFT_211485 [Clathrospora elynae]|uniref:Uncharacterized protein n=1 Tax=Clathrospora elynae TaxID=706981 RepID=A0A6A5SLP6_9PLEO|nr:hypothetical protein EJ02DRAFT_211485 [Clathrospora elynae]
MPRRRLPRTLQEMEEADKANKAAEANEAATAPSNAPVRSQRKRKPVQRPGDAPLSPPWVASSKRKMLSTAAATTAKRVAGKRAAKERAAADTMASASA